MKLFNLILLRRSVECTYLSDKLKKSGDDDLVWLDQSTEGFFQSISERGHIGLPLSQV